MWMAACSFEKQEDKPQDKTQCLRFELIIKTTDTQLPGHLCSEGNLKACDPIQGWLSINQYEAQDTQQMDGVHQFYIITIVNNVMRLGSLSYFAGRICI